MSTLGPYSGFSSVMHIVADTAKPADQPGQVEFTFQFFESKASDGVEVFECADNPKAHEKRTTDALNPSYWGTVDVELFGKKCQYKNRGGTTGKLFCGSQALDCIPTMAASTRWNCGKFQRRPMWTCVGPK